MNTTNTKDTKTRPSNNKRPIMMRNSKSTESSVGLDVDQLEQLLCRKLVRYTRDTTLLSTFSHFKGLVARYRMHGVSSCHNELDNATSMLMTSLDFQYLPMTLVYEVHSTIGQIREILGERQGAIQSYLNAFWIASARTTHAIPKRSLGLTMHRLGQVYSECGNHFLAKRLLERAVNVYQDANMENEPCARQAREMIKILESAAMVITHQQVKPISRRGFSIMQLSPRREYKA